MVEACSNVKIGNLEPRISRIKRIFGKDRKKKDCIPPMKKIGAGGAEKRRKKNYF